MNETEVRDAARSTLFLRGAVAANQGSKVPVTQIELQVRMPRTCHEIASDTYYNILYYTYPAGRHKSQSPLNHKKSSEEPLPPMSSRWPRFTEQFPSFGSASRSLTSSC